MIIPPACPFFPIFTLTSSLVSPLFSHLDLAIVFLSLIFILPSTTLTFAAFKFFCMYAIASRFFHFPPSLPCGSFLSLIHGMESIFFKLCHLFTSIHVSVKSSKSSSFCQTNETSLQNPQTCCPFSLFLYGRTITCFLFPFFIFLFLPFLTLSALHTFPLSSFSSLSNLFFSSVFLGPRGYFRQIFL